MDATPEVLVACVVIGFLAQIVDGALGMAYGVTSTSFLLSIGFPPALASASVHTAEIATTAVSGLSHLKIGNVDMSLFRRLVIPGVIGGVVGAYILTEAPEDIIKVIIAIYLVVMGLRIIQKALAHVEHTREVRHVVPLGLVGGFLDAIGGGGWGPVVTTTLVGSGYAPRFAIGSVNLSEFFVTFAESLTFFLVLGTVHWPVVLALLVGGVPAAPLAAYMSRRLSPRKLMFIVGCVIIALSLRTIYLALAA